MLDPSARHEVIISPLIKFVPLGMWETTVHHADMNKIKLVVPGP